MRPCRWRAYQGDGAGELHIFDGQVVQQAQLGLLVDGCRADEGRSQAVLHRPLDGFYAIELLQKCNWIETAVAEPLGQLRPNQSLRNQPRLCWTTEFVMLMFSMSNNCFSIGEETTAQTDLSQPRPPLLLKQAALAHGLATRQSDRGTIDVVCPSHHVVIGLWE